MTLTKYYPIRNLDIISKNINKFFDEFPTFNLGLADNYFPKIDISEDEKNLFLEAEIPGVDKKDIKVSIQDNILTISGEKKKEEEKKEKNYFRSERCYGTFSRSFTLGDDINKEKIDAKFQDGILKVKLEKVNPKIAEEKFIEIN